jgi:hypothetical protein
MTQATTTRSATPAPASELWHLDRIVESLPVAAEGKAEGDTEDGINHYGVDVVREAFSILPIAVIDDVR